jgi:hypothetical protein
MGYHRRHARPITFEDIQRLFAVGFFLAAVFVIFGTCLAAGTFLMENLRLSREFIVSERKWDRSVPVLEFKNVFREAWANKVPKTAKVLARVEKVRSHRQVFSGYRTETEHYTHYSGYGKNRRSSQRSRQVQKPTYRQEPVNDTWVSFKNDEWTQIRTLSRSGTDEKPAWPYHQYPDQAAEQLGALKVGTPAETYRIVLTVKGTQKRFGLLHLDGKALDETSFALFRLDQIIPGKIDGWRHPRTLTIGTQSRPITGHYLPH